MSPVMRGLPLGPNAVFTSQASMHHSAHFSTVAFSKAQGEYIYLPYLKPDWKVFPNMMMDLIHAYVLFTLGYTDVNLIYCILHILIYCILHTT